jgi:dephospho-CoA kinase
MINVGLTGGMASGKNFTASVFQELGCHVIDADALSKEAAAPGGAAAQEIFDAFGSSILKGITVDEYVNAQSGQFQNEYLELRSKLRKIVTIDPEKRELLEKIIHPAVDKLYAAKRKEIARKDSSSIIVYHAPLIVETYLKNRPNLRKESFKALTPFDIIILVWVKRDIALKRLALRGHPPLEEAVKLMDAQLPFEEKARFADHIIDNNYDMEQTRMDVKRIFNLIKLLGKRYPSIQKP